MAKLIKQFRLFIATPSDISEEKEIISQVVNEWNLNFGQSANVHIETTHWTTHSYPEYGDRPQAIINKQIVEEADIIIGVFWTRFGSPTGVANSGTEEEIKLGIKNNKKVMVYFSDHPVSLSKVNYDEYQKIIQFKEEYKDRGLYFSYTDSNDFRNMLRTHLSRIMNDITKSSQISDLDQNNNSISMAFSHEYWVMILASINESAKGALSMINELRDSGTKQEDLTELDRRALAGPIIIQSKIVDELHKVGVVTDEAAEKGGFKSLMKKFNKT